MCLEKHKRKRGDFYDDYDIILINKQIEINNKTMHVILEEQALLKYK